MLAKCKTPFIRSFFALCDIIYKSVSTMGFPSTNDITTDNNTLAIGCYFIVDNYLLGFFIMILCKSNK